MTTTPPGWPLDLLDWKRRVADMYLAARSAEGGLDALTAFRASKDALFRSHPQSPLTAGARATFTGLDYFEHHPDLRTECPIEPASDDTDADISLPVLSGEAVRARRIGHVRPEVDGSAVTLAVYWLEGYGGGIIIPFRDATSGTETYGGGRYLLDTIKSADLGASSNGAGLIIDFNYAYNPSCAYDPEWVCPLAPIENRLAIEIRAGERLAPGAY